MKTDEMCPDYLDIDLLVLVFWSAVCIGLELDIILARHYIKNLKFLPKSINFIMKFSTILLCSWQCLNSFLFFYFFCGAPEARSLCSSITYIKPSLYFCLSLVDLPLCVLPLLPSLFSLDPLFYVQLSFVCSLCTHYHLFKSFKSFPFLFLKPFLFIIVFIFLYLYNNISNLPAPILFSLTLPESNIRSSSLWHLTFLVIFFYISKVIRSSLVIHIFDSGSTPFDHQRNFLLVTGPAATAPR